MLTAVRVRVLGDVCVTVDGLDIPLPGGKQLALLAMLALQVSRSVPADRLVVGLWGEDAPPEAVKTLQVHVSMLRKRLRQHGIDVTFSASGYSLSVDVEAVDLARFETLAVSGLEASVDGRPADARELLGDALGQWSGEPLSNVLDAPFASAEVERLLLRRTEVAVAKVDADLAIGLGSTVVKEVRGLAAANPYDERVCGQLLVALYRAGEQAQALTELRRFRVRLRDELGLSPGPELKALEQRILVHDDELLVPAHVRQLRRHNLPEDVAAFIGRDRELDDVRAAVDRSRLTTVTGAGGAGKTRLAIAAARLLLKDPADGVWLVELAALADAALVPRTIAAAVGLRAGDIDELTESLRDREAVIVLDNCEHLVDAVADVTITLLQRCPNLKVLATSREPLAIEGERVYRIPPLGLPSGNALRDLATSEAVQLFVDRAGLQVPGFTLDVTTGPLVARICERVDGLPLAIELAAARLSSLPLGTIAQALGERLSLLSGSHRRAATRQQTIHALVDWSYSFLREDAKATLQVLSVFAGGFTLDEVASVTGQDAVDLVTELVDKSLVEVVEQRSGRFRLLETIREFAAERLAARGGQHVQAVRNAHADYFLQLASAAAPALNRGGRDQPECLDRLAGEHDNLRAAAGTLLDHGRLTDGLRMTRHLRQFWDMRGHFREGATITQSFLDDADPADSPHDYGMALCTAADMYESLGDLERVTEHTHRAHRIGLSTGDVNLEVCAAVVASNADVQRDEARLVLDRLQQLKGRDLAAVDPAVVMRLTFTEAFAALACEEWALAREALCDVIDQATRARNDRVRALAMSNLSVADMALGDLASAAGHLEQADALIAPLRDPTSMAYIRVNLGMVALLRGETAVARTRYREALLISGAYGEQSLTHGVLLGIAVCAPLEGPDSTTAIKLHGVVGRFLEAHRTALDPLEMKLRDDDLVARRHKDGDQWFDQNLDEGRRLTVANAVDLALSIRPTADDT